jgi:hypothetical protein
MFAGSSFPDLTTQHPSSAQVKVKWGYSSIPPYIFIGWFLSKHRDRYNSIILMNKVSDNIVFSYFMMRKYIPVFQVTFSNA